MEKESEENKTKKVNEKIYSIDDLSSIKEKVKNMKKIPENLR